MTRIARHPLYYDKLKKENGIPVMVFEIQLRRKAQRIRRGSTTSLTSQDAKLLNGESNVDDDDDDFTDDLVSRLRKDLSAIRIQSCIRAYLAKQRHLRMLALLNADAIAIYKNKSRVIFSKTV